MSWDLAATAFVGSAMGGGALVGMVVRRVLRGRRGGALSVVVVPGLGALAVAACDVARPTVGLWDALAFGAFLGIGALVAAHRAFGDGRRLALLLASVALSLGCAEVVAWRVLPMPPDFAVASRRTLFIDPVAAGDFAMVKGDDDAQPFYELSSELACHVVYDERVTAALEIDTPLRVAPRPAARATVLPGGDSVLFGFGVEPEARCTSLLELADPTVAQLNAGIQATAPEKLKKAAIVENKIMRAMRPLLASKRSASIETLLDAVVFHLAVNDLADIDTTPLPCAGYQTLLSYPPHGPPVLRHPTPSRMESAHGVTWLLVQSPPPYVLQALLPGSMLASWTSWGLLRAGMALGFTGSEPTREKVAHLAAILRAARDETRARGAAIAVQVYGERAGDAPAGASAEGTELMVRIAEREGVPVLDARPALAACRASGQQPFLDRVHLSLVGHRATAAWMRGALTGLLAPTPR